MRRPVFIFRRNIRKPGVRLSVSHRKYNSINYMFGRNTDKISHFIPLTIQFQPRLQRPQRTKTKCFRWLGLLGHLRRDLLNVSDLQPSCHWTFQIRKTEILKFPKQKFWIKENCWVKILKYQFLIFFKIRNFSQVRVSLESFFLTF